MRDKGSAHVKAVGMVLMSMTRLQQKLLQLTVAVKLKKMYKGQKFYYRFVIKIRAVGKKISKNLQKKKKKKKIRTLMVPQSGTCLIKKFFTSCCVGNFIVDQ